jgi:transcriptional regulator GlxA family with amidase domain
MHFATVPMMGVPSGRTELQVLVCSVVDLLNTANRQLDVNREAARASISRASSLLWVEANKGFDRSASDHSSLLGWQIRRVSDHIDAHLGGRILVSDLSAIVQRSQGHFSRAFKRTFGVSPHLYILRRRVERASHLMLISDDSLSDIALACGMADQAHLCRIFRQITGRTPAAWRRERRALVMEESILPEYSEAAA